MRPDGSGIVGTALFVSIPVRGGECVKMQLKEQN